MRLLFITDNFPPESNAPAARTHEHCQEWIKQGIDVTVITCAPNFPTGKVFEGYRNRLFQKEIVDNITVIRVWSFMAKNEGFAKRIVDYLSFAIMAFFAGLFRRYDVIVATSPQFFTTFAGFALSVLKRKPWVFELRDLWPDSILAVGAMKPSAALRFLDRAAMYLYGHADMIIPVTEAFKTNLIERGIRGDKIHVVTNGVNLQSFAPRDKNEDLKRELGLAEKFVVGYFGTHGMSHGLGFILNSVAKLENSNIHFLFIGSGAEREALIQQAKDLKLENVTFLPPVQRAIIADYYSILDVGLVPLIKTETFRTVIPSKIFELAGMEIPILLGVDGQAREILEYYHAGLYFEPENEDAFLDALYRISDDPGGYEKLQAGCQHLAREHSRSRLAGKMLEHLQELSGDQ